MRIELNVTYALANNPEIILEDNITGPSSPMRLFVILGLMISLLGSVTPEDKT